MKYVRMHDEGMLTSAAMAVASGKVLYRDIFEFWTPVSVYITAGSFSLFGHSMEVARGLYSVLMVAITILAYLIARRIHCRPIFIITAITILSVVSHSFVGISHHLVGTCFLLVTMLALDKLTATQAGRWAVASGVSASLTFLSMQLEGAVALIAVAFVLIYWFGQWKHRLIWLTVMISFVLPLVVVCAILALVGGLHQAIYSTIIFPLTQYRSVNGEMAEGIQALSMVLLVVLAPKWVKVFSSPMAKIWLVIAVTWQVLMMFTDNSSLALKFSYFILIIIVSLLPHLLVQAKNWFNATTRPVSPFRFVWLAIASTAIGVVIVEALLGLAVGWRNIWLADQKVYFASDVMYARPHVAEKAQQISDYVSQNTNSDEPVYFGPYSAHYQLLTQRMSPISYSQLTPAYNPPWMFEDAVAELESSEARVVVFLPQENPFTFQADNELASYIMDNYKIAQHLPFSTMLPSVQYFNESYQRQLTNQPTDAIWLRKGSKINE